MALGHAVAGATPRPARPREPAEASTRSPPHESRRTRRTVAGAASGHRFSPSAESVANSVRRRLGERIRGSVTRARLAGSRTVGNPARGHGIAGLGSPRHGHSERARGSSSAVDVAQRPLQFGRSASMNAPPVSPLLAPRVRLGWTAALVLAVLSPGAPTAGADEVCIEVGRSKLVDRPRDGYQRGRGRRGLGDDRAARSGGRLGLPPPSSRSRTPSILPRTSSTTSGSTPPRRSSPGRPRRRSGVRTGSAATPCSARGRSPTPRRRRVR